MTLLCVAVQNAHTTVGLYDGEVLVGHWRLASDQGRTADEWGLLLAALADRDGDVEHVDGVAVCSAVPAVSRELRSMVAERFADAHTVFVGPGVRSGLPVLTDNPREVGTDRIANAIAAVERFGAPCIVVDFGTATTFEVVNEQGQYVGGAIAPGVHVSLEALRAHGAQLRQVELATPRSAIAKNTVEALQSGVVFGFAGQVDALVGRMCDELGVAAEGLHVVATGSYAEVVVEHCATVTDHEPWLTLDGLRIIFTRNS